MKRLNYRGGGLASQCLNCWGVEPPNCFLNPPPNTLPNYVQGVSYILYHNFVRSPTVEKFNPQLIFHNSNTVASTDEL